MTKILPSPNGDVEAKVVRSFDEDAEDDEGDDGALSTRREDISSDRPDRSWEGQEQRARLTKTHLGRKKRYGRRKWMVIRMQPDVTSEAICVRAPTSPFSLDV